jgi:SAM-dependent methyltransferase
VATEAALRQSEKDDQPNSNGPSAPPPPSTIDTSVPHPARRYDYWLGGKDNFEADRTSGDAIARVYPAIRTTALENRRFLHRAVRFLAEEAGIRQFLDIGTGIPTSPNTHEIAQAVAPDSRVVYVDNDPIVLTHARARLTGAVNGPTAYIDADVRDPARILNDPELLKTLDLSRPVAVLMIAVLHFIPDPMPAVQYLVRAMAPGSYLAITHITKDLLPPDIAAGADDTNARSGVAAWFRHRDEFAAFFHGLDVVPPGIRPIAEWRDDRLDDRPSPAEAALYGAVARIP